MIPVKQLPSHTGIHPPDNAFSSPSSNTSQGTSMSTKYCNYMSKNALNQNNIIINQNKLNPSLDSSIFLHSPSTDLQTNNLPVHSSDHVLARSMPTKYIQTIQKLYYNNTTSPNSQITSCNNIVNPYVTHSSFFNLLTYGDPIDDSVFYSFFKLLRACHPECHTVDTNFHCIFMQYGWETAYKKIFHSQSQLQLPKKLKYQTISRFPNNPDSHTHPGVPLGGPCSSHNCGEGNFFNSDDMNSANSAESIRLKYFSKTPKSFCPIDTEWINYNSYTYVPHSNECGPLAILTLTIMSLHPYPSRKILPPIMN